jgi:nucleoside phosphorylase
MPVTLNVDDIKLNYDPSRPQQRFRDAGLEAAFLAPEVQLPDSVPWPAGAVPVAAPLNPPPADSDDLSRFKGYDAVVVTWTAVEAAAMATLLTPGYPISTWYLYRHNVAKYIPLVTGKQSPFNDNTPDMARYYHTLALYLPCQIGKMKVLLMKSGLHLDYDGPATPVKKLMTEIAQTTQPKLFITTGTGGAIGSDVLLGDVVIAGSVRFDCTKQFKHEPWHNAVFTPANLPAGALAAITPALTQPNASRIPNAANPPNLWSSKNDAIVTTDFFAFDDSTDHYKLQDLGRACDMGDAMVANALQGIPNLSWYAIRNASDPQIPNPTGNIKQAAETAAQIYAKYGGLTTAASVIATWAVIKAAIE